MPCPSTRRESVACLRRPLSRSGSNASTSPSLPGGLVLDGHSEKSPLARQVPPKAVIGALRARAITLGRALIEHLCVSVLVLLEQPAELRSLGSLVGAGLLAVPLVDALRRVHHVAVPGVHHRSAELNLSHGDVASQALDPQQHGLALCSIVDVLEAGSGASGQVAQSLWEQPRETIALAALDLAIPALRGRPACRQAPPSCRPPYRIRLGPRREPSNSDSSARAFGCPSG